MAENKISINNNKLTSILEAINSLPEKEEGGSTNLETWNGTLIFNSGINTEITYMNDQLEWVTINQTKLTEIISVQALKNSVIICSHGSTNDQKLDTCLGCTYLGGNDNYGGSAPIVYCFKITDNNFTITFKSVFEW